jgi:hypothetical protein
MCKTESFIRRHAFVMSHKMKNIKWKARDILKKGEYVMCVMNLRNFIITTNARTVEKQ